MHPVKPYHRKPLKGERVWIEQVRMSDIPVGSDPHQFDTLNASTPLVDGWTVMHSPDHEKSDQGLAYMDLVNVESGQRIELVLWPELPHLDNKAGPQHPYHLTFATLGGAQHALGYDTLDEAVAAMVDFSTYRSVFRLAVLVRGMSLCSIRWQAGTEVVESIDDYHKAVSWGDKDVLLVRE